MRAAASAAVRRAACPTPPPLHYTAGTSTLQARESEVGDPGGWEGETPAESEAVTATSEGCREGSGRAILCKNEPRPQGGPAPNKAPPRRGFRASVPGFCGLRGALIPSVPD